MGGQADHLEAASLALRVGVSDDDWIWRIHPLGISYLEPVLPQLRANRVKFLVFPELGQPTAGLSGPATACEGSVEAIDPGESSTGLRIHGHLRERGDRMRVVDRESRVRGLAMAAPPVQDPRAAPNDFVWAELESWTGRLNQDGNWLGFATWGSGPPFKAELVDDAGKVVCQAPITCCHEPRRPLQRQELVVRGNLPEGWLDAASCTMIAGWAWDSVRTYEPVDVRIEISDGTDMTVAAAAFRQDLLNNGMGTGRYGFVVGSPALKIRPGTWTVSASIAATGMSLRGSPKTVMCTE